MTPLVAWLHLSDIHFGHGSAAHGWDQQLVLSCLQADLAQVRARGVPSPKLVLVTGDIAFSGGSRVRDGQAESTEYQEASRWLRGLGQELGILPSCIFVVPGNHDVQRSADEDPAVARLVEDLREGRLELDSAWNQPGARALLARRQARYLTWAAEFGPTHTEPLPPPEERLLWTHRMEVSEGLRVRLVGLNTALLCANDADRGRLRLGNAQLVHALKPAIEPNELVVVLSHHPFRGGWLADEQNVDAWIRNHAHLHLSGHVHEANSEQARSGAGGLFVRVVAGAAHGEQLPAGIPSGHGYNLSAVFLSEDGQLVLRVWPRRWSDKHKRFTEDSDNVPTGQLYSEHPLRLTLRTPQPSRVTPPRGWRGAGFALAAVAGLGFAAWGLYVPEQAPPGTTAPKPTTTAEHAPAPDASEPTRPTPSPAPPRTLPESGKPTLPNPHPPRQQLKPKPSVEMPGTQAAEQPTPSLQSMPTKKTEVGNINMGNGGVAKISNTQEEKMPSDVKVGDVTCGDNCTLEFNNQTSR
jgi:predicted MPP superfamily phosphohydrolase